MNVSLIPTPYKILAGVILLALLMASSAFAGWHTRGWKDDAARLKRTQNDIRDLHAQFSSVVNASNAVAGKLATSNRVTEASIANLTNALGDQTHAFSLLQTDIRTLHLGDCSFTPAADGLFKRAYQNAFGAPAYPVAPTRKAGRGHAVH